MLYWSQNGSCQREPSPSVTYSQEEGVQVGKLNAKACKDPSVQQALETAFEESLQHVDEFNTSLPRNTYDLTRQWET